MPLMDGLEATTRLREWERNHHVGDGDIESNSVRTSGKLLIIGVSANSDSVSKQEALDAGMDHFLSKPMKMSVLRDCLADFSIDLDDMKNIFD